jgi:tripartite ATP-independent transporter DctP family solute receptor
VLAAVAVTSFFTATAAQAQVALKFGHDSPTDIPYHVAAEYFKERVERETEGRVTVQIFPNAQLGDEATMISGLALGSVDIAITSIAPISELVSEVELYNLPFLFTDIDHAVSVANGEVGDALRAKIEPAIAGKVVAWGSLGERDMWNAQRPIASVEDLRGLKMRIQQSATQQQTYEALGALPTPIPFTELFTALQTGVVDGADNGPLDVLSGFYQVTKYMTMTRHFIVLNPVMISDKALERIGEGDRETVLAALRDSAGVLTEDTKAKTAAAVEELKGLGLEISELTPEARKAFVDAVAGVYDQNADRVGGRAVIDSIIAGQ